MVFLCVGVTGNNWLENPDVNHFGLYEECNENRIIEKCQTRKKILKFDDELTSIILGVKDKGKQTRNWKLVALWYKFFV